MPLSLVSTSFGSSFSGSYRSIHPVHNRIVNSPLLEATAAPNDDDDWDATEGDLMDEIDEDLDENIDELDLDDIDSDGGLKVSEDYYDDEEEDDVKYDDDDDNEGMDDGDDDDDDVDDDDDPDIDENDSEEIEDEDSIEEEIDEEYNDEDEEDYANNLQLFKAKSKQMDNEEKPEEGWTEWWKNYGYDTREEFENSKLFPDGWMEKMMKYEDPDDEFWDDEVTNVPLEEKDDDPIFNEKLKAVEESSARRKSEALIEAETRKEMGVVYDEPIDEIDAMDKVLDEIPNDDGAGDEFASINESDIADMDIMKELKETKALYDEEPYRKTNKTNILNSGVNDDDMKALDDAWKDINEKFQSEPWNKVEATRLDFNYSAYPKQYMYDMEETAVEIESASYDVYPWLKYDLDFNVSNLILAAVKHNPNAPLILQHWYPQLMVCERYQHARDRDFEFTWDDVDNADMTELERYYYGFGYEEIPYRQVSDTGMISLDEADEEEIKMAAFEKWMQDVYNSEWDRKDFDDDSLKEEDNVFSKNFKIPQHPDEPAWEDTREDIEAWKEEFEGEEDNDEALAYRDHMGRSVNYTRCDDVEDFQKNFRGHLIIACGPYEDDLDIAEIITTRMKKDFGNRVYAETRIYEHATKDDNVFEVWLESYEIDLLHSRRRNMLGAEGWDGPAEVNDAQLNYLVKEIAHLTSDDAKISYRWDETLV